jgi:purine-nucleoside/S-methyl-5'-thioadenosine phosphorylase / adenosine deaminase
MIEAEALKHIPGLRHGFFTRRGGHSQGPFSSLNCGFGSGDERETVARNRAVVANALNVAPDHLLTVYQEHSPKVVNVTAPWSPLSPPHADAMVTAEPGIALGVLTADCAPLVFVADSGKVAGVAHAGWKGALSGVAESTVEAMEALGAKRSGLTAVIGPAISAAAYEVGPEFHDRFLAAGARNASFFKPARRSGHWMFDLTSYIAQRLRDFGVGRVTDLGLCTYSGEDNFFSYRRATHRREPQYGRLISAIAIVP